MAGRYCIVKLRLLSGSAHRLSRRSSSSAGDAPRLSARFSDCPDVSELRRAFGPRCACGCLRLKSSAARPTSEGSSVSEPRRKWPDDLTGGMGGHWNVVPEAPRCRMRRWNGGDDRGACGVAGQKDSVAAAMARLGGRHAAAGQPASALPVPQPPPSMASSSDSKPRAP
eukprot:357346-Chlamydomonas_euryale.AAC.6